MSKLRWARRAREDLQIRSSKRITRQGGLKGEAGGDVKGRREKGEMGEERGNEVEMMIMRVMILMIVSCNRCLIISGRETGAC